MDIAIIEIKNLILKIKDYYEYKKEVECPKEFNELMKLIHKNLNKNSFENSITLFLNLEESDEFIIVAILNSFNKIFSGFTLLV